MSEANFSLEGAEAKAAQLGLRVVLPKPNELFIDIDSARALEDFEEASAILGDEFPGWTFVRAPSASGKKDHFHITVTLPRPVTELERICLQAALGSDRKRELLAFIAHRRGYATPTVFFELAPPNFDEPMAPNARVVDEDPFA